MKKLNYWNVKEYESEEDKKECEDAWDKDIELRELTSMEEFIMKLIHILQM